MASDSETMEDVLRDEFYKIGYDLWVETLDALQYGVAQPRKRALIVGRPLCLL